jgi:nucleoside phosphorylase
MNSEPLIQNWNSGSIDAEAVTFGNTTNYGSAPAIPEPARRGPSPMFGIISALTEEFVAFREVLDDASDPQAIGDDRADYVFGTIPSRDPVRPHSVALTMLGATGNDAAADACANLRRSFPSVGYVLMVGIAAGIPHPDDPGRHVRLGDIVVATWGIVDYDHVDELITGPVLRQPFPRPSPALVRRAKLLEADEIIGQRPWEDLIDRLAARLPGYARPEASTDLMYMEGDPPRAVPHPPEELSGHRPGQPKVHYGRIGSADRSLRNAALRDDIATRFDLRAVEMEGKGIGNAGFAGGLEWLVVRGISDYGHSRTTPGWRGYASVAAAAYVRALLAISPPADRDDNPHR